MFGTLRKWLGGEHKRAFRLAKAKGRPTINLGLEVLEDRVVPIVGAYSIPAPVAPGTGYDGVVQVNGGTGSLLTTGRHILTAAHVVDVNRDRIADTQTMNVVFDMPTGPITIPTMTVAVHP